MKVTYVSSWGFSPTNKKTPEMHLALQVSSLSHEVECFTYGKKEQTFLVDGIKINSLRYPLTRPFEKIKFALPNKRIFNIRRKLVSCETDVWHLHHPSSLPIIASFLLRNSKEPIVFTNHDPLIACGMFPIINFRRIYFSSLVKSLRFFPLVLLRSIPFNVAREIIVFSNFERKVIASYGFDKDRIHIIPHGVVELKKASGLRNLLGIGERPLVLTVARFVKQKGHEYLIKAIPTILRHRDAHFVMIGREGKTLPQLRTLSAKLGVSHRVSFMTNVSEEILTAAYNECDIFVLPTLYESFGLVVLEAMAAGKPVVVSDVGGMSELVQNMHNGILVEPMNSEALASAIISLLSSTTLASGLGKNAKEDASRYSWKRNAEKTVEIYEKFFE